MICSLCGSDVSKEMKAYCQQCVVTRNKYDKENKFKFVEIKRLSTLPVGRAFLSLNRSHTKNKCLFSDIALWVLLMVGVVAIFSIEAWGLWSMLK